MTLYQYKKGDIVEILADLPPGLGEIVAEGMEGEYAVKGKLGTVIRCRGNTVGLRVEGLPRDTTWQFNKDEVRLIMKGM